MNPINTTILFNRTPMLIKKINPFIYSEDGQPQEVIFFNEKKVKFYKTTNIV
jgi:hypothetical protein